MLVPISEITVNPGRREARAENIRELADSISEVGLLNPITVDCGHTLIAGLHRLEAARLLGWSEIECTVSDLDGLQAELAEIDENFVRADLSLVDYGNLLLRRKEIYEALHPETKNGGDRRSEDFRTKIFRSDSAKLCPRYCRKIRGNTTHSGNAGSDGKKPYPGDKRDYPGSR